MTRIRKHSLGVLLAAVALTAGASPANAGFTIYTDRASFDAASSTTTIDFELAPTGGYNFYDAPGLTIGGANFRGLVTGGGDYLYVVDPAYSPDLYDWGSGDVLLGPGSFGNIVVTLTPGVRAVGVDLMTFFDYAGSVTVTLSTGDMVNIPTGNYPDRQFLGFTSDVAITSVTYHSDTALYLEMDNFSFGEALNPTPAPPGAVLFAVGVVGLAGFRRLRARTETLAAV